MTDAERKKAFQRAQKELLKARTALLRDTRDEIVGHLKTALEEIQGILASAPADYQHWDISRLQREIDWALAAYGEKAAGVLSSASLQAWELGVATVDKPLADAGIGIAANLPAIDTRQLMAMRTFMTGRIKDIGATGAKQINTQLGLVMIGAQGPSEAIGRVREILGDPSRERATTIVRTEIGRAYAVASNARRSQAKEFLPGLKKQWRRSGKIHSRLSHDAADGQIREIDQPFVINSKNGPVKLMHPHDPKAPASEIINCGCLELSYMASWDVVTPGRWPYTAEEIQLNPMKRDMAQGKTVAQARAGLATKKQSPGNAAMPKPPRAPWGDFPDALIHAPESAVKRHPDYSAAKAGDVAAAVRLVADTLDESAVTRLSELVGGATPRLAGVHAVEGQSVNVIPVALAATLSQRLGWPVETGIIQINRVGHTGADGYHRLATPALFGGAVESGTSYVLVDDFLGQGGTLANLRGYIEQHGGSVTAATVLTGKPYSAKLKVTSSTLEKLREKHGTLEDWWRSRYGYGFELLTESEARYLDRSSDADAIRARLAAAAPGGSAR